MCARVVLNTSEARPARILVHDRGARVMTAPPTGKFADSLFGGDPGLCGCCISDRRIGCLSTFVTWCFPGVVVAQLFQRIKQIPDSFAVIAVFVCFTTIAIFLLNSLCGDQSGLVGLAGLLTRPFWPSCDVDGCTQDDPAGRSDVCGFADWLAFTSGLVVVSLFMVARAHVRAQYGIPPGYCGPLDDCCAALWCLPCAASQLMRHVGAHEETEYRLFSADGAKAFAPTRAV